jgi:hypothetical protein
MYASARLPRRLGSRALGGVPGVYCFPCDAFEDIASSDVVEFALPAVLGTRFPGSGAVYSAFHDPKCALPSSTRLLGKKIAIAELQATGCAGGFCCICPSISVYALPRSLRKRGLAKLWLDDRALRGRGTHAGR